MARNTRLKPLRKANMRPRILTAFVLTVAGLWLGRSGCAAANPEHPGAPLRIPDGRTAGRSEPAVGIRGQVGCAENPKRVQRLEITAPGVYENYLVDGQWVDRNLVKINADDVTLRHCEIRNGLTNGVTVYAADTVIDSCRIHHQLKATYRNQNDAHGITGRPQNLVIRNCEVYYVSGDAVQFDPGRGPWDNVLIENCTFWTGPLPADATGFKKAERPGENALDTKQSAENPRSRVALRNCVFYGWNQPSQIRLAAALNIKENVEVRVERCLFHDNEVCFRLRGPASKERGGALVTISDCAVYDSAVAVRMEDKIANLRIVRLGIGPNIRRSYVSAGGGAGAGFVNEGEYTPPPFAQMLQHWGRSPTLLQSDEAGSSSKQR